MPNKQADSSASQPPVYRQRLRSPLRWLSAVMGGLMMVALAGIAQQPWLVIAAPVLFLLFLFAPPIGIYRHDETPVEMTRAHLEATPIALAGSSADGFRLTLVNDGDVAAVNFRMRLLIPVDLVPAEVASRALGTLHLGTLGQHWFTETTHTATAITFRAGRPNEPLAVVCAPRSRCDLIDLLLPAQQAPYDVQFDYQINGGTVSAALSQVRLHSDQAVV
jgi:hypothetical protein